MFDTKLCQTFYFDSKFIKVLQTKKISQFVTHFLKNCKCRYLTALVEKAIYKDGRTIPLGQEKAGFKAIFLWLWSKASSRQHILNNLFKISNKSNIIVFEGANMLVTTSILKKEYQDYSNPLDKIKRDAKNGVIFRLTRGIYETDKNTNPCLLASSILSPSYLSFDWALSYYGLIPEKVMAITSASLKVRKNKTFINKFGRFEYSDISSNVFSEGLTYLESGDYIVKIATKEKAICDSLSKWRVVRNIKDLKELLFVDKRIDEDEFASCDFNLMMRLAALYNKTNLNLLIKLVRKEYTHE